MQNEKRRINDILAEFILLNYPAYSGGRWTFTPFNRVLNGAEGDLDAGSVITETEAQIFARYGKKNRQIVEVIVPQSAHGRIELQARQSS